MGVLFFLLFIGILGFGFYRAIITRDKDGDFEFGFAWRRGLSPWIGSVAALLLFLSYTTINAGSVGVVKRQGNPVRQLQPGPHFVIPIYDSVENVVTQTRIIKPTEDAASKDLQVVHFEVTLAYHVDSMYATDILVKLNNDAETRVITPAILEAIKSVTAQYDVQELVGKRPEVRDKIEAFVTSRLAPYHIVADTTSITDFKFSDQYEQSIEAKVVAQQKAEQATNDLNRIKVEAEQKIAAAKGEAEALRAQKEQITPELLQLRMIEMLDKKWNGQLPETYFGGQAPLPIVDAFKNSGKKQ